MKEISSKNWWKYP